MARRHCRALDRVLLSPTRSGLIPADFTRSYPPRHHLPQSIEPSRDRPHGVDLAVAAPMLKLAAAKALSILGALLAGRYVATRGPVDSAHARVESLCRAATADAPFTAARGELRSSRTSTIWRRRSTTWPTMAEALSSAISGSVGARVASLHVFAG